MKHFFLSSLSSQTMNKGAHIS